MATPSPMYNATDIPIFQNLANFRDVGTSIDSNSPTATLKRSLFYRSARPDGATPQDRELLTNTYKIKTIIDLRTSSEHVEQAKKLAANPVPSAPALTPSDPHHPVKIPGIDYKEINFNGHAYSRALIGQLSYWNVTKLASLYAVGYRNQAISVLGENVMAKRGLVGLAEDSLMHCTAEVKACFDVLSEESSYPVLVHCTQGKDRTGLVVLLVAMLMGADKDAVRRDYMLTQEGLKNERDERVVEIRKIGLPDSFADCDPEWVDEVWGFVEEQYGGIEAYLQKCGVGKDQMKVVRRIMAAK